jgi:hypothetical protein
MAKKDKVKTYDYNLNKIREHFFKKLVNKKSKIKYCNGLIAEAEKTDSELEAITTATTIDRPGLRFPVDRYDTTSLQRINLKKNLNAVIIFAKGQLKYLDTIQNNSNSKEPETESLGLSKLERSLQSSETEPQTIINKSEVVAITINKNIQDACFELQTENWQIKFLGKEYSIRQSVGMQYITHLIKHAYSSDNPEMHVSVLYYLAHEKSEIAITNLDNMSEAKLQEESLQIEDLNIGLEQITPETTEKINSEIQQLKIQLKDAETVGNSNEVDLTREKIENLEEYILKAHGLHGKVRKSAGENEKNRKSIQRSIKNSLSRLRKTKGDCLADYLDDHIKTGIFCSFRKDPDIDWKIIQ